MHCKICDAEDAKYIDEDWYCDECQESYDELMDEWDEYLDIREEVYYEE